MIRHVCVAFCVICAACSKNQPPNDPTEAGMRPASAYETRTATPKHTSTTYEHDRVRSDRDSTERDDDVGAPRDVTPRERDDAREMRPADDAAANRRDTDQNAVTPIDQSNDKADLEITRKIRQSVMSDGSLSFTAQNVKIITVGGKVTLRGAVKNAEERASIEAAARRIAGQGNVDNQLEVEK